MRKIISFLLSSVMLLSCISFPTAIAADDDFIEIWNIEDLYNVRYAPDKNYILMTDIDFSQEADSGYLVDNQDWKTIDSFSGVFDGNHHSFIGLTMPFICESSGTIKNLDIKNADLKYTYYNYENTFGAFTISNSGSLEYCRIIDSSIPDINVGYYNNIKTGGLTAYNSGKIRYCANINSDVSSSLDERKKLYMGGLCADNSGIVEYCYCNSVLHNAWTVSWTSYTGGICGLNTGIIENCYFSGSFTYMPTFGNSYVDGIARNDNGSQKNCYTTAHKTWGENCYQLSNDGADNSLSEVQMQQERYFAGFDFDNVWIIDKATEYKYPQLRDNRQDVEKVIDSIVFQAAPSVVTFRTEDAIKSSGKIRVYYIDGTHEDIAITTDMLSGYDMNTAGKQTVTVSYRGFTLDYTITVTQRPDPIGVTLLSQPTKTEFIKDTKLDYTGGKARIFYKDGTTDTVDLTPENTTGVDISKTGSYTATFSYKGFTVGFNVTVVPVKVTKINILTLPDQVTYVEGQSIDRTGLSVQGEYNNGSKKLLTDYDLTYKNTAGKQTVTVSYSGVKATFAVTFTKRILESVSVVSDPTKTDYYTDESFDNTGMVVYASYNNGLSEEINDYTVSAIPNATGMQMLEVSYGGKSTFIAVTVNKRTLKSVKITKAPNKTKYNPGEAFDKTGMVVTATYNNGTTKAVTDYTVSSILSDAGGSYVNITYGGFTCKQTIHVHSYVTEVIAPTCTAKGYTKHICTACGDTYNDSQTNATGHSYGSWTKLNDTQHRRICKNDSSHTETANHSWDSGKITKTATCTVNGVKSYTCTICKATKTETLMATGHSYGSWVALNDRQHQRVCSNNTAHIEKANHTWDSGKVTKTATCTANGTKVYTCTVCKATKTETVKATGHNYGSWTQISATQHQRICKNDNSHIEKASHTWDGGKITTVATCTTTGIKTYTCTACKATKTESVKAIGHSYGAWIKLNDTQHQRICANNASHIEKQNHTWNGGKITSTATCTTTGVKIYTCTVCKATKTEAVKVIGHNYGVWTKLNETQHQRVCTNDKSHVEKANHTWDVGKVTTAATCTSTGVKIYTCTVCKATKTETVKAIGHSYGAWTKLNDTQHQRVCANDISHVEKANHTWDKGTVTKAPTATAVGIKTYTCSVCRTTKTETIAKLPAEETTTRRPAESTTTPPEESISKRPEEPTTGKADETTTNLPEETTTAAPVDAFLLGDVDFDGNITAADARLALRASVGLENFNAKQTKAADADKDGKITAADARLILRCSVGLEDLNG